MIAKLTAIDGPEKGLEYLFDQGSEWILGRDPESCHIVLSDPKVSRQHASIRKKNDLYFISNLSQSNPIRIGNEEVLDEKNLQFEDRIKIGDSWFRFSEVKVANEYDSFFEDTTEFSEDLIPGMSSSEDLLKEEQPTEHEASHEGDFSSSNDPTDSLTPDEELSSQESSSILEGEPGPEEDRRRENTQYDTIFEDLGDQDTFHDLSEQYMGYERFILKVLAGPNTGAEFAMQKGRSYVIGTDVTGADIIFNDLSVSRHHARLSLSDDGEILIEDLSSRNGVIVDGQQVDGERQITSKNMVTLGTTTFIVIDRELGEATYVTERPLSPEVVEEPKLEIPLKVETKEEIKVRKTIKESTFLLTGILFAVILVVGIGAVTLFKSSPVERPKMDFTKAIQTAIGEGFPDIKYTFNATNGTLFLVGHVLTTVDKEELFYNLNNLTFISQIDDNVVVDDAVGQEMNLVLSRYPIWRSISIHSPQPGRFVMSGYLPTREEGAELEDFVNVQFPYVDRLTNYVIIEDELYQDVMSKLHNYGFYSVQVVLSNGDVSLSGHVNASYDKAFEKTIREISRIVGVRTVNNYVVIVGQSQTSSAPTPLPYPSEGSPGSIGQPGEPKESAEAVHEKFGSWLQDSGVVNITDYQEQMMDVTHMYTITGYADQGPIGRAVVIKGRILTVGDYLNGMRILAILDHYVFLEKNGLKYKIEFNR